MNGLNLDLKWIGMVDAFSFLLQRLANGRNDSYRRIGGCSLKDGFFLTIAIIIDFCFIGQMMEFSTVLPLVHPRQFNSLETILICCEHLLKWMLWIELAYFFICRTKLIY